MNNKQCIIIGVAGGTGSGKTTFTDRLKSEFGNNITVLHHDNYYKSQSNRINTDHQKINRSIQSLCKSRLIVYMFNIYQGVLYAKTKR